ncbi:MAG: DUF2235 domain-containing protein [Deltaproteobacteria bacterium]|nr:DUF2235 domain-containing protein [Deltaproteobacteria bacterium]
MKRIVLCFDGTWNKPADENLPANEQVETNVRRFFESVEDMGADGVQQPKWYDEGVGTRWYNRYIGGALGIGLEKNILDGYKFLAQQYEDGDEVYIIGFSRGAYTARSLVGLIRNCGLVYNKRLAFRMAVAYGIYRTRSDGPDSEAAKSFKSMFAREIKIKFLGVWDTVGALGIPLEHLEQLNMKFYEFHDTRLSTIVEHAYHAMAIDEHREAFDVCLWNPDTEPAQELEQRWFVGAHCDVGGGYIERELSDITLGWMQDKAAAMGLALTPVVKGAENFRGVFHDSYAEFLRGVYAKKNARHYRTVGPTKHGHEKIDESVEHRRKEDSSYEPQNDGLPPLV